MECFLSGLLTEEDKRSVTQFLHLNYPQVQIVSKYRENVKIRVIKYHEMNYIMKNTYLLITPICLDHFMLHNIDLMEMAQHKARYYNLNLYKKKISFKDILEGDENKYKTHVIRMGGIICNIDDADIIIANKKIKYEAGLINGKPAVSAQWIDANCESKVAIDYRPYQILPNMNRQKKTQRVILKTPRAAIKTIKQPSAASILRQKDGTKEIFNYFNTTPKNKVKQEKETPKEQPKPVLPKIEDELPKPHFDLIPPNPKYIESDDDDFSTPVMEAINKAIEDEPLPPIKRKNETSSQFVESLINESSDDSDFENELSEIIPGRKPIPNNLDYLCDEILSYSKKMPNTQGYLENSPFYKEDLMKFSQIACYSQINDPNKYEIDYDYQGVVNSPVLNRTQQKDVLLDILSTY